MLPSNTELGGVRPPLEVEPGKAYSLAELIDIAQSNNPTTRIAWDKARQAALAAGIAESTYLPRLTATVVGAYQASDQQSTTAGVSASGDNTAHGAISALSFEWLLFDFGERAAVIEAAKQASVISNIAFTTAHQMVIYNVSIAFYANAAAKAHAETAQESLRNTAAVQAAAEARYKQGIGTVIEVAQARQATAQANLAVIHTTGAAQDAYLALITVMGVPPLTKIEVADVADRKLPAQLEPSIENFIAAALMRRPDMLSAFAAQKASLAKVRASEAEFLPKFFIAGTGAYASAETDISSIPSVGGGSPTVNLSGSEWVGTIFAGITVPIYDAGRRSAMLAQARAEADSADATMTRVRDNAVLEIVIADNALRTSLSANTASKALLDAAQTTFDAALAAYKNGVGSVTDVMLAQNQLLQARNASTDSYNAALAAAATLALSAGALGAAPQ